MKRMMVSAVVLCLCGLAVYGCASIIHGTSQDVGISSQPSQAEVVINNQTHGKTPLVAKLSRKDNHIIKINLPGYQPYETTLTRNVSGWVWGNVLFGGLIGLAVDAISGGIYNLTPEQIVATMASENVKVSDNGLYIAIVLLPQPEWNKVASLTPQHSMR